MKNEDTKHTPGPWHWVKHSYGGAELVGADNSTVADDGSADGEYSVKLDPDSPNGRLIASAPEIAAKIERLEAEKAELLAALEGLLKVYYNPGFAPFDNARAAIAKAKAE